MVSCAALTQSYSIFAYHEAYAPLLCFLCCNGKHRSWIIKFILLFINPSAQSQVNGNLLHSCFSKLFHVPGRAEVRTDGQLTLNIFALLHQGISKLVVGMVFREIGGFGDVCGAVVGIKIQEKSAWF